MSFRRHSHGASMDMSMDTTHDPFETTVNDKLYNESHASSTPSILHTFKGGPAATTTTATDAHVNANADIDHYHDHDHHATATNDNHKHPLDHEHWDLEEARGHLRHASQILSKHGLKLASAWASEQLVGLAPGPSSSSTTSNVNADAGVNDFHNTISLHSEIVQDLELHAKSIFDLGEYHRAAAILSVNPAQGHVMDPGGKSKEYTKGGDLTLYPSRKGLTPFGIYLRSYSLYMAGEKRKEEEVLELRDPLERTAVRNNNLPQLLSELHEHHRKNELDAFGLYIYGVILKESQRSVIFQNGLETPTAQTIFIQSLIDYQYNWSAWIDLAELCISDPSINQEVEELLKPISTFWMYHFFCVHVFLENHANDNAIMVMERLIHGTDEFGPGFFVSSAYLQSQLAVAHYDMRDFDTAKEHFNLLSERNPQRLDKMDVYSNILYVKEEKVALSSLAHRAMKLDKYRPETCCIVGNYYSLKAQHEKAVTYFQRALKLDRTYLGAWTLMGHEYIEMKNTAAAIEAYRRAVDINPKDFRPWYGLGQAYEMMSMLLYALFYFRKAAELRPYDARMWCAMGGCYLGLERRGDAIRSYERAVTNHDAEGIATLKLAMLYREDGKNEKAARCYLRHLELRYQAQVFHAAPNGGGGNSIQTVISSINVDEPEAESLLYLAYYYRDHDEFDMATLCCSRLLDYPGPEKEEGKALQREIRSIIDGKGNDIRDKTSGNDDTFDFSP